MIAEIAEPVQVGTLLRNGETSVGTFQLRTRVSTDASPTGTVNNKPSWLFLCRFDYNASKDSGLSVRVLLGQLNVTSEAFILLVPVSKREEFV